MDISDTLETKLQSVRCYETQFPPEKAYVFDRVRGGAEYTGALAGFQAGELFFDTKTLGTDDLVKTVLPE